jgi:hypothetical protein
MIKSKLPFSEAIVYSGNTDGHAQFPHIFQTKLTDLICSSWCQLARGLCTA